MDKRFGEIAFWTECSIHVGGGVWIHGRKIGVDTFRRDDGMVIGVSYWTIVK